MVEQQKIDIAEESTASAPAAKTSKKENTNKGHEGIQETEKGKDQDNASGQGLEDLKESDLGDNETVG